MAGSSNRQKELCNQGMYQVRVRGLAKVKTILLWYALALNLLRAEALRAERAQG